MPSKIILLLGDALEQLSRLPSESVDLVFTSPPYNLGEEKRLKGGKWTNPPLANGYAASSDNLPHDVYVRWQKAVLAECWRLLRPTGAIYYNHKPRIVGGCLTTALDLNPGLPVRQIVIWNRRASHNFGRGFYARAHEWIIIFAKPAFELRDQSASGAQDVWTVAPDRKNPHPAPFPVELPRIALETTGAQVVLDPFMGSGTTGVAAIELGREFIGIEKSEEYMIMAKKRLAQVARKRTISVRTLQPITKTQNAASSAVGKLRRPKRPMKTIQPESMASSKVVTFRCPIAVHDALRTLAFEQRSSIQKIIEDAVATHLARCHVPALATAAE